LSDTSAQNARPKLKKYPIKDIPAEHFFSEPVYLDKQFILAAPEMPFTQEMINALKDWEFTDVYSAGDPVENYAAKNPDIAEKEVFSGASTTSDGDKIVRAEEFYAGFTKYTETVFTQASFKNELQFSTIAERIKEACDIIKEDRRYLLRVQKNLPSNPSENYLVSHSVKSTIISIIIGFHLKLPNHRLIELGVSALLHEVGMVKLPPQIYLSQRPLESHEQKAITTHPILGYNILKASDFPLTVTLAALEHHERENGSGYPRQLTGERISLYAKIIAVACSYEALSAQRPHKKAKDGYTGMLELLKNEGKQYDDTIVRALVFSLSIYPIGLYVLLSTGRKGQVVDVNPEHPRFPIVQIFGELTPDGKNKVLETSADGVSIVRPLTKEEMGQDLS
jgi:HD-GYP domain-containing protein (c-di-GMP phosphodiesterase class II)